MAGSTTKPEKKILIVFPDDWAPFSPTLTRFVDLLVKRFDVEVLAFDSGRHDLGVLDQRIYTRVAMHPKLAGSLRKLGLLRIARTWLLARRVRASSARACRIIAVDADGATASRIAGRRMHYLSLEVARPSLARWIVPAWADSIVIQSRERLDYQFEPKSISHVPVFLVQNAPDADAFPQVTATCDPRRPRLVYMGNLIPGHGLFRMLDMLAAWPEATLVLRGIVPDGCREALQSRYRQLFESGRVELLDAYLHEDDIPAFLSHFDIGLCLYEPPPNGRLDFNYESAPAGKMFNYFAAGLPVLASSQAGLRPVMDFEAGIQAESNAPAALLAAGRGLVAAHARYRRGALNAARAFDFTTAATPFLDYIASAP